MRFFFRARRTLKLKHQPDELTQGRLYVQVGECVELELTDDEAQTLIEPPVSAVTPISEAEYREWQAVQAARVTKESRTRPSSPSTSSVASRREVVVSTEVHEVAAIEPPKPNRRKPAPIEPDADSEGVDTSASDDAEQE